MSLDRDIDLMRQVPFFSDFSEDQLRLLAFGAETRVYRARQVMFRQGDLADSGFVLTEGQVRMTISEDGIDVQSQVLGPGSLIGEMAMLAETRRVAMATAIEDVRAIQIRRVLFRRVLDEYPDLAVKMHDHMSNRLASMVLDLETVSGMIDRAPDQPASLEEAMAFALKE